MPVMHTAIPCTGNTADQAVNTVHVQLGATKHLTRPLTGTVAHRVRAAPPPFCHWKEVREALAI